MYADKFHDKKYNTIDVLIATHNENSIQVAVKRYVVMINIIPHKRFGWVNRSTTSFLKIFHRQVFCYKQLWGG